MTILVTGANGQVGQALQARAKEYKGLDFYFATSAEANITDTACLDAVFSRLKPQYCINAAAYTAVDKAEAEKALAFSVNVTGAKNLAEACKKHRATLLHISTDFVFDGLAQTPYTEDDKPNPQSIYGNTKYGGELEIQNTLSEYYIIRTSWVYSEFGNNFMKTMVRLAGEKEVLHIVDDQAGSPTNAKDLADALIQIVVSGKNAYGIYNYSNEGATTWYGFAVEIFRINKITIRVNPIATAAYPTPAKRPAYSVLSTSKIKDTFGLTIRHWKDAIQPYGH
jgi:dTDP-4-dehydrorhamnose reductase